MKIIADLNRYKANKNCVEGKSLDYIRESIKSKSILFSIFVMFFMLIGKSNIGNISKVDIYILIFCVIIAFLNILIRYFNGKYEKDIKRERTEKTKSYFVEKIIDLENRYTESIDAKNIRKNDIFILKRGDIVPCNAIAIEGAALLDESCITGESAAVLVEKDGDINSVKEGTRLISDFLIVKAKTNANEIKNKRLVNKKIIEDINIQSKENKITLYSIILAVIILFVYLSNNSMDLFNTVFYLLAIYIAILPDDLYTILKCLKLFKGEILKHYNIDLKNINSIRKLANVRTILIDKTGTLTFGNREAIKIYPAMGVSEDYAAEIAALSSVYDNTPEGKSILVYVKQLYSLRGKYIGQWDIKPISFTTGGGISGCDIDSHRIRKGSEKAIESFVLKNGGTYPEECRKINKKISLEGGTPLSIAIDDKVVGIIYLKDIIKHGLKNSFRKLEKNGYNIVLATGDNALTAATISAECGINKFIAEATPDNKLNFVQDCQIIGDRVAVVGDGENDIYAMENADVSIVMGNSNEDVKNFGDIIDNDSDPAKITMIINISREVIKSEKVIKFINIFKIVIKFLVIAVFILSNILNKELYLKIDVSVMYLILFNLIMSVLMMIAIVFHKKEK